MASLFEEVGEVRGQGDGSAFALSMRMFFKHPAMVGSGFPASRWMVRTMLAPLDWRAIRTFVEYGPGAGAFTHAILDRLAPDAKLVAIDTSPDFVSHLKASITDRRLYAVAGSATSVEAILSKLGLQQADCILSGLPFSTISREEAGKIMLATRAALRPAGQFCAYQMRRAVEPLLRSHFSTVWRSYEWRNIPPCHLYWAKHENVADGREPKPRLPERPAGEPNILHCQN